MLQRVDVELAQNTAGQLQQKRQAIESEYQRLTAGLVLQVSRANFTVILDALGGVRLALFLAFSWRVFAKLIPTSLITLPVPLAQNSSLLTVWITSAACVVVGLGFDFPRTVRIFSEIILKRDRIIAFEAAWFAVAWTIRSLRPNF
ncbi:MAG: hypothetical protein HY043_23500 [Verrucomicrobia bacterium]|nr:hypothetical protein [Verrucomicrobiota bacterium]